MSVKKRDKYDEVYEKVKETVESMPEDEVDAVWEEIQRKNGKSKIG